MAPPVEVDHLSKRFGSVLAVDELSFRLDEGTVTGFLGPNGAGKTTTLRMLLGLVRPTAGSALVFGWSYRDCPGPAARVGAVFEAADFHPGRSRIGSTWSRSRSRRVCRHRARRRVLEVVELDASGAPPRGHLLARHAPAARARGRVACAIPELLILDEPANGLDPEGVHWLRSFVRVFAADGKTVLVSSHVLAEVEQTVDRVVIIDDGRLVTIAELDELTARMAGGVRAARSPGFARSCRCSRPPASKARWWTADEVLVSGASAGRDRRARARGAGIALARARRRSRRRSRRSSSS